MSDVIYEITPRPYVRRTYQGKFSKKAKAYHGYLDLLRWNKFTYKEDWGITFIMPMAPSWTKGKKFELDGQPHRQEKSNDLDNLLKAVLDSLPEDDGFIARFGPMQKRWGKIGKIIVHERTVTDYF